MRVSLPSPEISRKARFFPRSMTFGEGPRTIGCRLNRSIRLARNNELRQGEMTALIKVEVILNL
jgi:hypothetical protein